MRVVELRRSSPGRRSGCWRPPPGRKEVTSSAPPTRRGSSTASRRRTPAYLQDRPDLVDPDERRYVAAMGARLSRAIPANFGVPTPVDSLLLGRRNNPPDAKKAAFAAWPSIIRSITRTARIVQRNSHLLADGAGKSPSTTGAGSEGALTKGPFNAPLPITDLNNALVSYILTGLAGFSTAAPARYRAERASRSRPQPAGAGDILPAHA